MATYYVDPAGGEDGNDGLAPHSAWQSLDRANRQELHPGDQLLLHAGSVLTGTLAPLGSGTPTNPIVIGRYGEGAPPVLSGAVDVTAAPWSPDPVLEDVWRLPLEGVRAPEKLFLDGKVAPWPLPRPSDLETSGQWARVDDVLFLRADGPPADVFTIILVPASPVVLHLDRVEHVRVQDVEIAGGWQGVLVDRSADVELLDLMVHHNVRNGIHIKRSEGVLLEGGASYWNGVPSGGDLGKSLGHGVLIGTGARDNLILGVALYANDEDGVQFGPEAGDGNTVREALIFGNFEDGIDIKQGSQNIEASCIVQNSENAVLLHNMSDLTRMEGNVLGAHLRGNALDLGEGARVMSAHNIYLGGRTYAVQLHEDAGDGSIFVQDVFVDRGSRAGVLATGGQGHLFVDSAFVTGPDAAAVEQRGHAEVSVRNDAWPAGAGVPGPAIDMTQLESAWRSPDDDQATPDVPASVVCPFEFRGVATTRDHEVEAVFPIGPEDLRFTLNDGSVQIFGCGQGVFCFSQTEIPVILGDTGG